MRPATNQTRFRANEVLIGWAACFLASNLLAAVLVGLSGHADDPLSEQPVWVTLVSIGALWVPLLVLLGWFSRRSGSGRWRDDYRLVARPVDLVGIPVGVLSQLVLIPAVYLPLGRLFPDTFSDDRLEERARELWDRAHGPWLVALVVVVALGAPLVEELVYRGLVQQSLQSRINDALAIVVSAAFFAFVHFQPVEFLGLFAFGVVLGVCFQRTGRLACPILAHVAFNAVGLVLASTA